MRSTELFLAVLEGSDEPTMELVGSVGVGQDMVSIMLDLVIAAAIRHERSHQIALESGSPIHLAQELDLLAEYQDRRGAFERTMQVVIKEATK